MDAEDPVAQVTLSKNQLKKQARKARQAVTNAYNREKRRERKRVVNQERAKRYETGDLTEDDHRRAEKNHLRGLKRTAAKELLAANMENKDALVAVALDMEFEDLMVDDRDLKSLCSQVNFCYGKNLLAKHPAHIYLSGLKPEGKIHTQLTTRLAGFNNWLVTHIEAPRSYMDEFPKEKIVYLTYDATEELDSVDKGTVYVIGALVDHNQHPGLTFDKATAQGIATRRLPIPEDCLHGTRSVITVNQVMDILLAYCETQDWRSACTRALPGRKQLNRDFQ